MRVLSFSSQLGQNLMTSFDGFNRAIAAMKDPDPADKEAMAFVSKETAEALYTLATAQVKAGGLKHIAADLFKKLKKKDNPDAKILSPPNWKAITSVQLTDKETKLKFCCSGEFNKKYNSVNYIKMDSEGNIEAWGQKKGIKTLIPLTQEGKQYFKDCIIDFYYSLNKKTIN